MGTDHIGSKKSEVDYGGVLIAVAWLSGLSYLAVFYLTYWGHLPPVLFKTRPGNDLEILHQSARYYLETGNIRYGYGSFVYPPLTIYCFAPLALFKFSQVFVITCLVNTGFLVMTMLCLTAILRHYSVHLNTIRRILMFLSVFFFYPISASFNSGQPNILIILLLTAFYYFMVVKSRGSQASLCLAGASALKLFSVVLLPFAFILKGGRTVSLFLVIMLLGILSSVLVFEASVHIQFAKGLFSYQSSVATVVWNIAPLSIIHKALQATGRSVALPGWATVSQGLVALALLCALTVYLRRALRRAENVPKELPILAYSLFTVFPFVFANHIEIYHAGVLVLPYALLFLAVPLGRKQRVLLVTSFALLAFHTHIIYLSQGISGKLGSAVQVGTPGALGILIFAGTIVHRLIYQAKQVC